ncbi:MAG: SPOR domain-containing protein [Prevotellaceae bacterium]|jgi:hypothetical protein|nr:SPOR domain-containing protein [Prevotellaceae bacterium]
MKKLFGYYLAAMLLVAAGGCDWFNTTFLGVPSTGQPSPASLAQSRQDSLAQADTIVTRTADDSTQTSTADASEQIRPAATAPLPAVTDSVPNQRYHVIVGSFKKPEHADRMRRLLQDKGYAAQQMVFKNGFFCVSVSSHPDVRTAREQLKLVLSMELCPDDVWVYDSNTLLHHDVL